MVASDQPFIEVDNPQFRKWVAFMRPVLETKLVHSTQLREKVDLAFVEARERFKGMIKVCKC